MADGTNFDTSLHQIVQAIVTVLAVINPVVCGSRARPYLIVKLDRVRGSRRHAGGANGRKGLMALPKDD
jgi:hypothetical protein